MAIAMEDSVGSYRVERKLGEGGFATAWRARHPVIGATVVIKALHTHQAERPIVIERFYREAVGTNLVDHPGIARVFDYGTHTDARDGSQHPYLVMEYRAGGTLRAAIEARQLGLRQLIAIFFQVADALATAHRANVVHRDVKEENVIVCAAAGYPGGYRASVIDFGIAKLGAPITAHILGTCTHMPPEQWSPTEEITGRADVYSLGIMMYKAVSGVHPLGLSDSSDIVACAGAHVTTQPARLPSSKFDAVFVDLVDSMLRKSAAGRPAMEAVAAALREMCDDTERNLLRKQHEEWRDSGRRDDLLLAESQLHMARKMIYALTSEEREFALASFDYARQASARRALQRAVVACSLLALLFVSGVLMVMFYRERQRYKSGVAERDVIIASLNKAEEERQEAEKGRQVAVTETASVRAQKEKELSEEKARHGREADEAKAKFDKLGSDKTKLRNLYGVCQDEKVTLANDLASTKSSYGQCVSDKTTLTSELTACNDAKGQCVSDKRTLTSELTACNDAKGQCETGRVPKAQMEQCEAEKRSLAEALQDALKDQ